MQRVGNSAMPPYSAIGYMAMRWSTNQQWAYGSGSLIDAHHILTCAHNLVDADTDPPPHGYADRIFFYPGYNQARTTDPPAGGSLVSNAFYPSRFKKGEDAWDVGICRLAIPFAPPQNFFYFVPVVTGEEIIEEFVNLTGYPGPRRGEMYTDRDQVNGVHLSTNTIIYTHDTWPGNSGSPTWTLETIPEDVTRQHAIHVSRQAQNLRRGLLITNEIYQWIQGAIRMPFSADGGVTEVKVADQAAAAS